MLTKTYALLSLSVEHARLRDLLASAKKLLKVSIPNRHHFDVVSLEFIADQFARLEGVFRTRKLERCIIPAIRTVTHEADALLDELESSNGAECQMLDAVRALVHQAVKSDAKDLSELHSAIEGYCDYLQERLKKEEKYLLPLAHDILSSEIWFAIGTEFLSMDSKGKPIADDPESGLPDISEKKYGVTHA